MEVTADELCTILVARIPMNRPTKGFDVKVIILSANPFPSNLKELPMSLMLTRKK
jgi:hypothetical protein